MRLIIKKLRVVHSHQNYAYSFKRMPLFFLIFIYNIILFLESCVVNSLFFLFSIHFSAIYSKRRIILYI